MGMSEEGMGRQCGRGRESRNKGMGVSVDERVRIMSWLWGGWIPMTWDSPYQPTHSEASRDGVGRRKEKEIHTKRK